jgi:hypothetical protein
MLNLKKLLKIFINKLSKQRELDNLKIQIAKNFFFHLKLNLKDIKNINQIYYKVFSQNGEDGIIQYILYSLKIENPKFVEIGTENYRESNTRYIYETNCCDGLIIDGHKNLKEEINQFLPLYKGNLKIFNNMIESNSILEILKQFNFEKNIDIFSIDIDGIDYWIIKKLPKKISKIFIAEYNPFFGPELEITVPDIKNFNRTNYHYSNLCWGASLKAIINILKIKGYTFIGVNELKNNAFFVLSEYLNLISLYTPQKDLSIYTNAKYREGRDRKYKLTFGNPEDAINIIKNCNVIDLHDNQKKKISDCIQFNL